MKKTPVIVSARQLEEILEGYFDAGWRLNYAIKVLGHPGVGKSAIVKAVAERKGMHFIDTRLAFKENIDLGGYPVPDHEARRMIYFRPRFIPPERVPDGAAGIVWFLDESNRAHPTVIQTLFQIITERTCGEHALPERTAIVLAGNLGEEDSTTITNFDDAALDGRLAVFQLRPAAAEWLPWATREGVHPSVMRYISVFPDRLWDERAINPNPRGWHQVSCAISDAFGLADEDALAARLAAEPSGPLALTITALIGASAAADFVAQICAPRRLVTAEVIAGDRARLRELADDAIPAEDVLWALSGAIDHLRETRARGAATPTDAELDEIANVLMFAGHARADFRISFFYRLLRDCGIFAQAPAALHRLPDTAMGAALLERFERIL